MNTTQREILGVSGRAVRWIIMFVLLSIATLSCKDDKREYNPPPLPPKGGNTDVIFEINVPKPTTPSTYALDKETEDQIKTVEILLFKIDPDVPTKKEYTGKPYYCDTISSGTGLNSANKHFIISLPAGGEYDIVVLANSRDAVRQLLEGDTPTTVAAKDELLKLLKIEHDTKWITDKDDPAYKPFPMWGELENETISPNLRFQTTMMRMLAKIDVTLSTPTAIASFELKEVILVNAHTMGRIVPDKGNIAPDKRVDKPTLVDGSETNTNKLHYTEATTPNVGFVNAIYTFESKMATPTTISEATFIIVKGLYLVDGKEYYYKLDLGEKKGGTIVYRHILRNFKYSIGINRIGGAGYSTLGEAITGPSSNIESTLVVWDNSELPIVVWDNDNSLGFSTDDITLGFKASTSKPLKVMTDYTEGWKVDKIVNNSGAAVDWLTLSPMKSSDDHKTSMEEIKFIVGENPEIAPRICWVYISAGALSHKVKVMQLNLTKIIWDDYDGVTGVTTNDNGATDTGLTSITVTQTDGNVQTSTISGGILYPGLAIFGTITKVSVTYKGYVLDVPEGKYTHTVSTKTLAIEDRSLIGKAVHLDKIRASIENRRIVGDYIQVSDVDLTSYPNWVPIGTQPIPFIGTYTGGYLTNEFKINNLTIDRSTTDNVGLFGITEGATLTKIYIASGSVSGKTNVAAVCGYSTGVTSGCTNAATVKGTGEYIGGICGQSNSAISNCTNFGTITGSTLNFVGGICGNSIANSAISGCKNAGAVTNKGGYVGGICGQNGTTTISGGPISECVNSGAITGGTGASPIFVGGICGYNDGAISDCENSGAIIGGGSYIGGICGYNGDAISDCKNSSAVEGVGGASNFVGGICGYSEAVDSEISDCLNEAGGDVSGQYNIGGICGQNGTPTTSGGPISKCTNYATVKGVGNYVGGIVGYNLGTDSNITSCHNEAGGNVSGAARVGGICGHNDKSIIFKCTNNSTITATGAGHAGGICGYNSGTVEESTNESLVEGKTATTARIGGICGQNDSGGKIQKCINNAKVTTLGSYIGGICGNNTASSEILECTNTAIIEGKNSFIGGICGRSETRSSITKCHNLKDANIIYAASSAGGICGGNLTGSEILGCTNAAVVSEKTETGSSIGGICGDNEGAISGCTSYATATVKGGFAGGICGVNNSAATISGCINNAAVTGTRTITNASSYAGGICGSNTGTILGSTNEATVTGIGDYVGGISGKNTKIISGCINKAAVTTIVTLRYLGGICGRSDGAAAKITASINIGDVSGAGSSNVGGICGLIYQCTISACYNLASVTGTTNVGAVIGSSSSGIVKGCYFGEGADGMTATTEITQFNDSGAWPNPDTMEDWSEYDATNNPTGYWSEIGGWPLGGTPTYPKLNTTP